MLLNLWIRPIKGWKEASEAREREMENRGDTKNERKTRSENQHKQISRKKQRAGVGGGEGTLREEIMKNLPKMQDMRKIMHVKLN